MISQVRTYINDVLSVELPLLSEWTDAYNVENIPRNNIDCYYHIKYNSITSIQDSQCPSDLVPVTLTIFKSSGVDTTGSMDTVLDMASDIRFMLLDPIKYYTYDNIKFVSVDTITPEQIDTTNDNINKVEIAINFQLKY